MSSGSQENFSEVPGELTRELRQFTGLAASFYRAAAARVGITVTDMQVIDILESAGPSTAGQLAEITGLTTGAVTGMLNRLEEAGFVHRERDPNDGRRVIVQLASGKGEMQTISSIFASFGEEWNKLASDYNDEQIAFLLEFLKRSNTLSRGEIIRLQEAPEVEGEVYSAPLGNLKSGQLVVSSAVSQLTLRTGKGMDELYQARFEGPAPEVKTKDGVVAIRYSRRLLSLGASQRAAEITLNPAIPWQITIQGGASMVTAKLGSLNLAGLEVKGGLSMTHLELPVPRGAVPIKISGGASEIIVHRPTGAAARAHLKGWVSTFIFDKQTFDNMGSNVWLQSTDFDPSAPYYDIEIASSASSITITAV